MQSIDSSYIRVGRQPILGRESQLLGYEILYRGCSRDNSADFLDGNLATANVLSNALIEFGLEQVVGESLAFVNFTKSFLTGECPIPDEPAQIVIEVLEDVVIDEQVIAGLQRLSESGYRIALDDFVYTPKWDPILKLADIAKLDVLAMSDVEVMEHVELLKEYDIALLAEKVETYDDFRKYLAHGFDMFQGYYFAKPDILQEKRVNASQSALLDTIASVNDEEADADDIAQSISHDAMLTHKLIRYVNSSAFARRNKVETLREVIVYLGKEEVRSIVTLLLMTSLNGKPPLLMKTALIRGKACQNIAWYQNRENHRKYFTAGLLSMLDALLDRPQDVILGELPLTEELKSAILGFEGPIGQSLQAVISCERADAVESALLTEDMSICQCAYAEAAASVETGEGWAAMLSQDSSDVTLNSICSKATSVV